MGKITNWQTSKRIAHVLYINKRCGFLKLRDRSESRAAAVICLEDMSKIWLIYPCLTTPQANFFYFTKV